MPYTDRIALTGAILFGIGLVFGVGIGSFTTMASLIQGGPDILQSWSGVVALP